MKHHTVPKQQAFTPVTFPEEHIQKTKLLPFESVSMQVHSLPVILSIISGSISVTVHNHTITLTPNDTLVIFKGNPYSISACGDGCRFYTLLFYPFSYKQASSILVCPPDIYLDVLRDFSFRYKHYLLFKSDKEILRILENMLHEYSSRHIYYTEMLISYSLSLLFLVFRKLEFVAVEKDIYINKHLITALEYLDSHYSQKVTIADVAKHCNISTRYLSELFHRTLDISVSQFIIAFRIDKAIELIFTKSYSLTEIAAKVGFSSLQHFSKAFRDEFGISPKVYQALIDSTNKSGEYES